MKRSFLLLVSLMAVFVSIVNAQPNVDTFESVDATPVNGWLVLLLVVAMGYGIKKLYYSKAKARQ